MQQTTFSWADLDVIREFRKSLDSNSGGITDVLSLTQGAALTMQSLEETMVSFAQTEADYKFLNSAFKGDVKNTLLEYNVLRDYGDDEDGFVTETGDPIFRDPILERRTSKVAFIAEGYSTSRVIGQVRTTEDPELLALNSAIHRAMKTMSRNLWYGDNLIKATEFEGMISQISASGNIYDAEGSLPDVKTLKEFVVSIRQAFGLVNDLWMSIGTKQLYDNLLIQNNREFALYPQANETFLGFDIPGLRGAELKDGKLIFQTDVWLRKYLKGVPTIWNPTTKTYIEGQTSPNAPNTPSFTAAITGAAVLGSKWKPADVLDINGAPTPVRYRVVAGNGEGRSAAAAVVTTATNILTGYGVDLVITPAGSGPVTTYFEIYRETVPGNGIYRLVLRIARDTINPTTAYQDINLDRPGTDYMILGDFNAKSPNDQSRTYRMVQLLPLLHTRFPEGVVQLRKLGGMVEFYGGLQVIAPQKFFVIKNVPVE